jgi:hypothetical protein
MKYLKVFESFGGELYSKIDVHEFGKDDGSELFQANEVRKVMEILKEFGYEVELENIFYNPVKNLNKVFRILGKKTSPLAKVDGYYKDEVVLCKREDDYYDVFVKKITEIPEQTPLQRYRGDKSIPIKDMDYLRADQFDGLEKLFKDLL